MTPASQLLDSDEESAFTFTAAVGKDDSSAILPTKDEEKKNMNFYELSDSESSHNSVDSFQDYVDPMFIRIPFVGEDENSDDDNIDSGGQDGLGQVVGNRGGLSEMLDLFWGAEDEDDDYRVLH